MNFKGDRCVVETPSGKRWVTRTRNKFHISYYPTETIKPDISFYEMDHNIFCDSQKEGDTLVMNLDQLRNNFKEI